MLRAPCMTLNPSARAIRLAALNTFFCQALSSKLLDKQARLEESQRARTTLSAKLKEASDRAFRAEQELRESRGESLEAGGGGGGGGMVRSRRGRQDRSSLGRSSPTGTWSRIGPIAKHKKVCVRVLDC